MDSFDAYCVYRPLKNKIERQPGVYRPFMYGNQYFIVAEQIIRNIQETLSLKIGMVTPSGEVILIDPSQHSTLVSVVLNHLLSQPNVPALPSPSTCSKPNEPIPNPLLENCRYLRNPHTYCYHQAKSIANRQHWDNRNSPIDINIDHLPTCSKSTSCSEIATNCTGIPFQPYAPMQTEPPIGLPNTTGISEPPPSFVEQCPFCSRLSAREQLKLRKLLMDNNFFYDYSTA